MSFDADGKEWKLQNYLAPVDTRKINPLAVPHWQQVRVAAGSGSGFRIAQEAQARSVLSNRAQGQMVHPETIQGAPSQSVRLLQRNPIRFIR